MQIQESVDSVKTSSVLKETMVIALLNHVNPKLYNFICGCNTDSVRLRTECYQQRGRSEEHNNMYCSINVRAMKLRRIRWARMRDTRSDEKCVRIFSQVIRREDTWQTQVQTGR
jgi:hypothetical protein